MKSDASSISGSISNQPKSSMKNKNQKKSMQNSDSYPFEQHNMFNEEKLRSYAESFFLRSHLNQHHSNQYEPNSYNSNFGQYEKYSYYFSHKGYHFHSSYGIHFSLHQSYSYSYSYPYSYFSYNQWAFREFSESKSPKNQKSHKFSLKRSN